MLNYMSFIRGTLLFSLLAVCASASAQTASPTSFDGMDIWEMLYYRDIWKANAGALEATWETGDFTNDGAVDFLDLNLWKTSFISASTGTFITAGSYDILTSASVPGAPAPEPGTLAMLAAGLFGVSAYAWRKRS